MSGKVNTNQKLELIRSIRMQNQYNRNQCRERERFLYGYEPDREKRQELHSAEISAGISLDGKESFPATESGSLGGFRIRFVIAVLLLAIFIFMDLNEIDFLGNSMREIAAHISESVPVKEVLNSFDL